MLRVSNRSALPDVNGGRSMVMCLIGLLIVIISLAGGKNAAIR